MMELVELECTQMSASGVATPTPSCFDVKLEESNGEPFELISVACPLEIVQSLCTVLSDICKVLLETVPVNGKKVEDAVKAMSPPAVDVI